jgi:hypothetical protein
MINAENMRAKPNKNRPPISPSVSRRPKRRHPGKGDPLFRIDRKPQDIKTGKGPPLSRFLSFFAIYLGLFPVSKPQP